ncbi:MAG TPA: hypothetical protein VE954_21415 [Oligoflexus sp.]|uniref:hypothetical protein n=1 Tax=Oligoflexus sp. TaxID=1971216 RepID=UPI002D4B836E|nr:hypothetical protein [Oligoflexus sp.]HYX35664.1 hypothetical protein [Oligoflexus sp.]
MLLRGLMFTFFMVSASGLQAQAVADVAALKKIIALQQSLLRSQGEKISALEKTTETQAHLETRIYHKYNFIISSGYVMCNGEDIAIGGGCSTIGEEAFMLDSRPVYNSTGGDPQATYPVTGGSGWRCSTKRSIGSGSTGIDANVICLTVGR